MAGEKNRRALPLERFLCAGLVPCAFSLFREAVYLKLVKETFNNLQSPEALLH